jgi:hypothetical protein
MAGRGPLRRPIQQPEIRLKSLQEHLILHIFNMLDNSGRINAFRAIGWSTKRYVQRRENLRKQIENKKRAEKEMAEREVWRKNVFKDVLNAGVNNYKGNKENEGESQCKGEEKKEEAALTKEMAKVTLSEETEPLPHLGTRIDPNTLLARLNTRRLRGRLKYYRAETAKQIEYEEKIKEELRQKGMTVPEPSIIEMYERDLKEKFLMDRIYPKNLTVHQMAQKEWNELLEMANYRCV